MAVTVLRPKADFLGEVIFWEVLFCLACWFRRWMLCGAVMLYGAVMQYDAWEEGLSYRR